jgi:hypothetical protein
LPAAPRIAADDPFHSSACAMRSATSSRQGAAMICTPIGSGAQRHRHGHRNDRQADEGDRLRVEAEIGAHRHFDVAEREHLLADQRRRARRRRRQDGVDLGEQLQHLASRYQRRNFCAFTTSEAGTIAPAISRSRTAGS